MEHTNVIIEKEFLDLVTRAKKLSIDMKMMYKQFYEIRNAAGRTNLMPLVGIDPAQAFPNVLEATQHLSNCIKKLQDVEVTY